MTAYRRQLRLHQARWRASKGHPIGTQPTSRVTASRPGSSGAGSRSTTPRTPARTSSTAGALEAAKGRLSVAEPHQMLDAERLWADLLWSPAMCFNLFGDLAADLDLADRAVHMWWPGVAGRVCDVRFAHSPGRLDPAYLGNLVALDVAFVLDLGDGTHGIVGVATAYHDRNKPQAPKPRRLPRYVEVTDRSGVFDLDAIDAVNGTELIHIWLEHMLVHSMPQHPSGAWSWGRFAVVHPEGNIDFADACARYRALLVDPSTFSSLTVEELLAADALPAPTAELLRDRYLPEGN